MTNSIVKAPCVNLARLNEIFIEMTAQNCNLRCKYCYIHFSDKKVKDFIPIDKIKHNLSIVNKENLQYIHLTGAEPMIHPDFNHILRLCLKYSSVIIHTNAMNINDKKARFLRKVEDENNFNNEIIFMISIDSCIEKENDLLRGRGSYRKAIHALQSLNKYGFNPILSIVNHKNLPKDELKNQFSYLCSSLGIETSDINFKIIPLLNKEQLFDLNNISDFQNLNIECSNSRTLTINGVFLCPLLSTDNRGRCGSDFADFSSKSYLETGFCSQCVYNNNNMFSILNI